MAEEQNKTKSESELESESESESVKVNTELQERMTKLFLNPDHADVTFIVDGQSLPAHRCILSINSEYFRGLLSFHSEEKYVNLNVNLNAFKIILHYIYLGDLPKSCKNDVSLLIDTLQLTHEYDEKILTSNLSVILLQNLNLNNALNILTAAHKYEINDLYKETLRFVDLNGNTLIEHNSFLSLPKELLNNIIKRNEFSVNELTIFNAIKAWGERQVEGEDFKEVLSNVRFNLMQINELRNIVEPCGVFNSSEISNFIDEIKTLKSLPYRNGSIHRNQMRHELISQTNKYTDSENKFNSGPMLFKLNEEKVINYLRLHIVENCIGYYIEVSQDQRQWKRIIDYSNKPCRSIQYLYFDLQTVRYIYFHPSHFTKYNIKELFAEFKSFVSVPMIIDNVIAPQYNSSLDSLKTHGYVAYRNDLPTTNYYLNVIEKKKEIFFTLNQPIYINCVAVKFNGKTIKNIKLETWTIGDVDFKKVDYYYDYYSDIMMFEPHVVIRVQLVSNIKFTGRVDFNAFYQPGKLSFFSLDKTKTSDEK